MGLGSWLKRRFKRAPARESAIDGFGFVPDPGLANATWFRQFVGMYQLVDRLARARGGNPVERPIDERMLYIARGLMRYNPYAQGMVNALRTFTLGARGLQHKVVGPSADEVGPWLDWWKKEVDWWSWEREWYERVHIEGGAVIRFFCEDDCVHLRPIELEWIVPKDGTKEWTFGFYNEPGDVHRVTALYELTDDNGEVVDATEWYHIKSKLSVRADKRGRSDFLAVASLLDDGFKVWRNFLQAEAVRAGIVYFSKQAEGVTSADIAQAIAAEADYTPPPMTPNGRQGTPIKLEVGAGVEHLQHGTELAEVPSGHAQDTMTGVNAGLLAAGRAYHLPLVVMTGDMSANNTLDFSDESPLGASIGDEQNWYSRHIRNVLWRVIEKAAEEGLVSEDCLHDGTNVEVSAERRPSRDPGQNTTRAKTLYEDGVISGRERSVMEGVDHDEQQAQRRREGVPGLAEKGQPQQAMEETEVKEVEVHGKTGTYTRKQKVRVEDHDIPEEHHGLAKRVADKVKEMLLRLTPAAMAVGKALGVVLDTPEDMRKFAYNPTTSSGTANTGHDPVKQNLADAFGVGVNGHIVARVVAYGLSHAVMWFKRKLKGAATEDADAGVMELAEFIHNTYVHTIKGLGGDVSKAPSIEDIAAGIRARLEAKEAVELVEKDITVHRDGKTFTQKRMVRPAGGVKAVKAMHKAEKDATVKDYIESAIWNADSNDPVELANQLGSAYRWSRQNGHHEASDRIVEALHHLDCELTGPEEGEKVAFEPREYSSTTPFSTGQKVTVVRKPVMLRDNVIEKGEVK